MRVTEPIRHLRMIKMILRKPYTEAQYTIFAEYCNSNNLYLEDKGEYIEAVKNNNQQFSKEDQEYIIRKQRNALISGIQWRIDRYKNQKELGIKMSDDEVTYKRILQYMQYLRDVPTQKDFPNTKILNFQEWGQLCKN